MNGLKAVCLDQPEVPALRLLHDGGGQRVLRGLFQAVGDPKQVVLLDLGGVNGQDIGDHRPALGEGARLVQHHRVDGVEGLQGLGGFDEDAVLRPLAGAHHNGYRGGQPQGAGAGDDQHGHAGGEGLSGGVSGNQPGGGGDQGDDHDNRDEHPGHLVRQLGYGGLGGGCLLHQADHLCQGGVLPHPAGLECKETRLVDGSRGHLVARALVHGEGLAGKGGLVHGGPALQDHPVHRDGLARPDRHPVAHLNVLYGNFSLHTVPDDGGRLGGQVHQTGNGLAGPTLGPGLQKLAQSDQCKNHTGGLKVQVHVVLAHPVHVPVAQAVSHLVDGEYTVDDGGGGTHSNETVHVGSPIPKSFETHLIILIVDIHDG